LPITIAVSPSPTFQAQGHGAQEGRAVDHVGQAVAGQAELVAALGADADEDGLVALREEVVDASRRGCCSGFDAELLDFGDFLVDDFQRHAVRGDAVARHAAGGGQGVEHGDGVALLGQVVGGGQAAGPAPITAAFLPEGGSCFEYWRQRPVSLSAAMRFSCGSTADRRDPCAGRPTRRD
jgi:hypothetical protein